MYSPSTLNIENLVGLKNKPILLSYFEGKVSFANVDGKFMLNKFLALFFASINLPETNSVSVVLK